MQRRTFAFLFALALFTVGPATARAGLFASLTRPGCAVGCVAASPGSGPLFVVTGHGWGHGVGMPQYGAYGYAQHGWTYRQMIGHYFTGTTIGAAPVSQVRVLLAAGQKTVTISSTVPFRVKDGLGKVHAVTSPSVKFGPGLRVPLAPGKKAQQLTGPLTFTAGAEPLTFKRPYRGALQVDLDDAGKLRVINVVGLEKYLYGVVPAEMPASWSPEALKAQAVVARSYALAERKTTGPFDLYPDTRSQMYLGVDHEQPSANAAVDATAGQVVLYGGAVAQTFFYSSSGGRTASSADVWGTALPYLVSVQDPYDTISPYHNWGPYPFTAAALAKALHVPLLAAADARTSVNSSGRVQTLSLVGADGNQTDVPATTVRSALGLRSTWFTVGMLSLLAPPGSPALEYGSTVTLTGIDRGVAQVSLEQRPAGGSWAPVGPVTPVGPCPPGSPFGPCTPVIPGGPSGPCPPWTPVAPVGPRSPAGPCSPRPPVAPGGPA